MTASDRGDHDQVAHHAEAGRNRNANKLVRLGRLGAGQDADRLASRSDGAARGRAHDAAQPAGDDDRPTSRQVLADLLGPVEDAMRVWAARLAIADDGDVWRARPDSGVRHGRVLPALR